MAKDKRKLESFSVPAFGFGKPLPKKGKKPRSGVGRKKLSGGASFMKKAKAKITDTTSHAHKKFQQANLDSFMNKHKGK